VIPDALKVIPDALKVISDALKVIPDALKVIPDALKVIPDALKMISDGLKVLSDDLPSCSLVIFLQIIEIGRCSRYTRYAATKLACGFAPSTRQNRRVPGTRAHARITAQIVKEHLFWLPGQPLKTSKYKYFKHIVKNLLRIVK
jgi:hypothetical protein